MGGGNEGCLLICMDLHRTNPCEEEGVRSPRRSGEAPVPRTRIDVNVGAQSRRGDEGPHAQGEESQPVRVVRPRRGQHILHRVPPGLLEGPVRALGEGATSPAIPRAMHRRELRRYMSQEHPVRRSSGRGGCTACETGFSLWDFCLGRGEQDASMPRETCERECWGTLRAGASQLVTPPPLHAVHLSENSTEGGHLKVH